MPGNWRPHGCNHVKTEFSWDCKHAPKEDHSVNRCIFTLNSMWILNPFTKPQKKLLCEKYVTSRVYGWLTFKDERGPRRRSCKRPFFYKSNPGRFTSLKLDLVTECDLGRSLMLSWFQLTPLKQKAKKNERPILTRQSARHALAEHWASFTHKV